uniref:Uncharacterized protein n=1 Tax=Podospora anserina (strain S / ATCC MYA-4624 / DSM 980 / FGSC 10383) TaxID=515849 RepID=A0A090CGY9_PODAN|nr:Putative protein of unknown function [Podospora anserina S mat+]
MIPPDFSSLPVLSPSTHQDSLTPLTQVRDRSWECTTRPTPPSALQASSAPHRCKALHEHLSTCRGEVRVLLPIHISSYPGRRCSGRELCSLAKHWNSRPWAPVFRLILPLPPTYPVPVGGRPGFYSHRSDSSSLGRKPLSASQSAGLPLPGYCCLSTQPLAISDRYPSCLQTSRGQVAVLYIYMHVAAWKPAIRSSIASRSRHSVPFSDSTSFLSKSGPLRRFEQTQTGKTLAPGAPGSHQDWPGWSPTYSVPRQLRLWNVLKVPILARGLRCVSRSPASPKVPVHSTPPPQFTYRTCTQLPQHIHTHTCTYVHIKSAETQKPNSGAGGDSRCF